jgi:hypothetical protein
MQQQQTQVQQMRLSRQSLQQTVQRTSQHHRLLLLKTPTVLQ